MHFSAPFIRRPVATFLMSVAVILAGAVAYTLLPVASLPQVEFPVISVGASLPGADPETMASSVATPLERQFSKIAGVNEMTSYSSSGSTGIILQFDLTRDVNGAARDVQAAINAARSQLPANLPSNPSYYKVNPADSPIMILALTSQTLNVPQLYDACDSILSQKIAQVDGVGQVYCGGSAKPAVRIEANPMQLSHYGLGLEALRAAIGTVNVNQPKGYLQDDDRRMQISATDQLFGASAYAPLVVATDSGPVSTAPASSGLPASVATAISNQPAAGNTAAAATAAAAKAAAATSSTTAVAAANGIVRIADVAKVVDSVEDVHGIGLYNGRPAILVIVFKNATANVIETVDNVKRMLPLLEASIPPAVEVHLALDRTTTIRASVDDVTRTMVISIVLVILVVFLFLREVRSTLIPSVAVPLSLLGTFAVMYMLGYTLDNLSLMALTISTGFVVDDAIVVIENISRHLEAGMTPFQAAMVGSKEIGFTVVSMSTSLIAVFIPILLMGGIVGRLFREFAVTLSVAILVSLVVSLTTTPMLSAKFLKPHGAGEHNFFYRTGERFLGWLAAEYELGLRWVLRHQKLVLTITVLTFVLNVYLYILVPKGFFPEQDAGRIGGQVQGQQDVSFDEMKQKVMQLAAIAGSDRSVGDVTAFAGGRGNANGGFMFMSLKPDKERQKLGDTAQVIVDRLRPKVSSVPGAIMYLQAFQDLRIGGRQSATEYQYTLTSDNLQLLNEWAPKLNDAMDNLKQVKDVASDLEQSGLRAQLVIDRTTASRLGVSPLTIDATLADAFSQEQVSTTYMPLNQYHVVMEVAPEFQRDPDALKNIYVKSTTGSMIPLSAVTHFERQRIPLAVNHQSQIPAVTLSFNLAPGASLSDATLAIDKLRADIGMPSSIHGAYAGSAQAFKDSLSSEPWLILLALIAVYIVLGILYESFIHPLTILSTLPSAGVGAIVALLLFNVDLSVIAMIGIILLIGIVKKNAIMMIDFALVAERQHGKTPQEAIFEACMLRFRPIMMTTMAALLGGLPLALGTGTGSEMRRPLGITIVGGLIVSQALTLFTTPVVYLFFDRVRGRFERAARGRATRRAVPQVVAGD
ncbi:efflux RND transporter permease subunit [Granulicella sp. L60]|uniref:efflux RND transporter permease subunit n=1 Tax=Granulicella sp. L60 TaxID=1641866 RepID=UPI00131C0D62|nr:efflux RND transporter permease subunit [Granulicella sp. L60]